MPPVFVLAIGTLGAAVLVKLLARESRRVNRELDAARREDGVEDGKPKPATATRATLRRDPATGSYRPSDH